jgi:hypothetical protein
VKSQTNNKVVLDMMELIDKYGVKTLNHADEYIDAPPESPERYAHMIEQDEIDQLFAWAKKNLGITTLEELAAWYWLQQHNFEEEGSENTLADITKITGIPIKADTANREMSEKNITRNDFDENIPEAVGYVQDEIAGKRFRERRRELVDQDYDFHAIKAILMKEFDLDENEARWIRFGWVNKGNVNKKLENILVQYSDSIWIPKASNTEFAKLVDKIDLEFADWYRTIPMDRKNRNIMQSLMFQKFIFAQYPKLDPNKPVSSPDDQVLAQVSKTGGAKFVSNLFKQELDQLKGRVRAAAEEVFRAVEKGQVDLSDDVKREIATGKFSKETKNPTQIPLSIEYKPEQVADFVNKIQTNQTRELEPVIINKQNQVISGGPVIAAHKQMNLPIDVIVVDVKDPLKDVKESLARLCTLSGLAQNHR